MDADVHSSNRSPCLRTVMIVANGWDLILITYCSTSKSFVIEHIYGYVAVHINSYFLL